MLEGISTLFVSESVWIFEKVITELWLEIWGPIISQRTVVGSQESIGAVLGLPGYPQLGRAWPEELDLVTRVKDGCLVNLRRRSGWHRSWRRGSSSGRAGWGWAASTPPTSCLRERGPSGFLGLPTSRYQFPPAALYVMMCWRSFPPNFCRFSPSSQALVYYMINETQWYLSLFVACFSVSLSHDHMAECAHVSWCPCIDITHGKSFLGDWTRPTVSHNIVPPLSWMPGRYMIYAGDNLQTMGSQEAGWGGWGCQRRTIILSYGVDLSEQACTFSAGATWGSKREHELFLKINF